MNPAATCTVDGCAREITDAEYVCAGCGQHLEQRLRGILDEHHAPLTAGMAGRVVPGLASSLEVAITKQDRFTQQPGSSRARPGHADGTRTVLAEKPLAFGYDASEALYVLRSTLATWAALIASQRGTPQPAYYLPDLAINLVTHIDWLRHQPAGHEAFDEILPAIRNAWRTVDAPTARIYAGPCTPKDELVAERVLLAFGLDLDDTPAPDLCDGHLYAREGSTITECDECGRTMALDDARDPLLAQIDGMAFPAADIVTLLGGLGSPLSVHTLRSWARRGLLTNHTPDARPTYLIRDVRKLADGLTTHHREAAS